SSTLVRCSTASWSLARWRCGCRSGRYDGGADTSAARAAVALAGLSARAAWADDLRGRVRGAGGVGAGGARPPGGGVRHDERHVLGREEDHHGESVHRAVRGLPRRVGDGAGEHGLLLGAGAGELGAEYQLSELGGGAGSEPVGGHSYCNSAWLHVS